MTRNLVPAEYYKVLEEHDATRRFLRTIIKNYWCSGSWDKVQVVEHQMPESQHEVAVDPISLERKQDIRRSMRMHAPSAQAVRNVAAQTTRERKRMDSEFKEPVNEELPPWDEIADRNGCKYEEWLAARMKLLPKKGDLHAAKNWRDADILQTAKG